MGETNATDILIVGAGPTGLTLACDLARRGRPFRIIDRKAGPSTIMKATAITPLSLEYFEDLGVLHRVLAIGTAIRDVVIYAGSEEVVRRGWDSVDSPYPHLTLLGQHFTEAILYERLRELGGRVEWETELIDFEVAGEQAVQARIQPHGTASSAAFARFLVGCDGGKSTVARTLGRTYRDHDFPTDYVVAEIEIATCLSRKDWTLFFATEGILAAGAMPQNRWGIMATLPKAENGKAWLEQEPSLEHLQAIWDQRSPIPGKLGNPQWMSHYRTHLKSAQGATSWPVVLAGDAAHQVSPLSAMGMNSGILDARNLAWRLDLACQGSDGADLLTSYDFEHRKEWRPGAVLTRINEMVYPWTAAPLRAYRDGSMRLLMDIDPIWKFYARYQTQKDRNLRRSPLVKQDIASPLHAASSPHLSDHSSCLSTWLALGEGPHAGDQWRDVPGLHDVATGEPRRLFEWLIGGQHTLLLFGACEQPSASVREAFQEIEQHARQIPDGLLKALFIQQGDTLPQGIWRGSAALDIDGSAHARYGAEGETLYLMRPDGFVAYRAQPPSWERLADFLQHRLGIAISRGGP